MTKKLRAAVIGTGSMGLNHARVYNELDAVELVGVADDSQLVVEQVGGRFRVPAYTDYRRLLAEQEPEAVTVAVPTGHHFTVARDALLAGVPTLIEKPIARTVEEGKLLLRLAEERGVVLTVGYLERFNPAVRLLKSELEKGTLGRIYQIHVRRVGPFPSRIKDVGVAVDLATHDLDVMHYLTGSPIRHVSTEISRYLHADHEDMLAALLRFENGVVGILDVSWLAPTKIRELAVSGEAGMFVVNYLTQDLTFYENAACSGNWPELAVLGITEGRAIRYPVARSEPLRAQLSAFVNAVRGDTPPSVSASEALLSLETAYRLLDASRQVGASA